jgi:glycosyltransferase involved in cell wall biosynthesis
MIVCKILGVPFVYVPHGSMDPEVRKAHQVRNAILDFIYFRWLIKAAVLWHFTSNREMARSELKMWRSALIAPFGVEPIALGRSLATGFRKMFEIPEVGFLFLFLSRITRKKGIDILLSATANLLDEGKQFYLALCGPVDSDLSELVERYQRKYPGKIVRTGLVYGPVRDSAFAESDCFVLPTYSENFGVAVFEAISVGISIITTTGMDLHSELKSCELVKIIGANGADLENEMRSRLSDGPRKREQHLGAAWLDGHFSWKSRFPAIEEAYLVAARWL